MICVFVKDAADLKTQEKYPSFQRTSYSKDTAHKAFFWLIVNNGDFQTYSVLAWAAIWVSQVG